MSKLIVEICKIAEIKPILNADKLELALIKGWQCIVAKGQYKAGDLIVFCPPDSVIPPNLIEKYKLTFLKKNGKVDSIKLRGEVSQGLILDIPEGIDPKEGKDVADLMGITKYEPPERQLGCNTNSNEKPNKNRANLLFKKYTDIENIKNFPDVFQEGEEVVINEKVHGSNFRAS